MLADACRWWLTYRPAADGGRWFVYSAHADCADGSAYDDHAVRPVTTRMIVKPNKRDTSNRARRFRYIRQKHYRDNYPHF